MHYAFEVTCPTLVTAHCITSDEKGDEKLSFTDAPPFESHTSEHLSEALTEAVTGLEVAEGQQHNPCYYRQCFVLSVLT